MKKLVYLIIIMFLIINTAFAETVILKSGKRLEGTIVEKTDKYIKIDIGLGMPITYFLDEIENIEVSSAPPKEKTETTLAEPKTADNIYLDEETGASLVFPEGWFVVSGKEKREQKKKEIEERFSAENFEEFMQKKQAKDESSVSPTIQEKEATTAFFDKMKKVVLDFFPLVSAYRYNPEITNDETNIIIQFRTKDLTEFDRLETIKSEIQLMKNVTKGTFVELPQEIIVNGIKGIRVGIESTRRGLPRIESYCYFLNADKEYSFVLLCNSQDYPTVKADFDKIINSLEIKRKKETL
jgi:hypothetical protein